VYYFNYIVYFCVQPISANFSQFQPISACYNLLAIDYKNKNKKKKKKNKQTNKQMVIMQNTKNVLPNVIGFW
jgi:hypothetical protein